MKRDVLPTLALPAASALSGEHALAWRRHFVALAAVVACLVFLYWPTGRRIVEIWWRSATFTHGFVVPVIAAWLIWRARESWRNEMPAPSASWLAAVVACGLVWACGELGTVNAVTQLAFVAMLVCAVPAVMGTAVARHMVFPLAFLFFAVPVGEFMLPALMRWTADFTVAALRVTGVPVYREGQEIVIPSGRWSVVEACSGIRYLIASLMVGTLYAYLYFRSLRRRLLFIGLSVLIPIVANWLRAYMIVMIGHLSNNRLAVGVDHLIYGWLFFGFVMFLMFWVGVRWRDDAPASAAQRSLRTAPLSAVSGPRSHASVVVVSGLLVAAAAVWPLGLHLLDARGASAGGVALAPIQASGEWQMQLGSSDSWTPSVQSPSALLRQTFRKGTEQVGLYVAYFRDSSNERKLVSSTNVLGGSGLQSGTSWAVVEQRRVGMLVDGRRFSADESVLLGTNGRRLVALQWYWIDGRMTANDALAKAYTFLARAAGRDAGAMIVVYAQEGATARRALREFVRDNGTALQATLSDAAGAR